MKEIKISSISEYINLIEKYKGEKYFRGQANSNWKIEPNIFRDDKKLNDEVSYLDITYETNTLNILCKLLYSQHYGTGTRLCDLTINPLVALYFSIEDDTLDNCDACVFVLDKSNEVLIDSNKLKVMLLLTTQEISTLDELKTICNYNKIDIGEDELANVIQNNYIINHDINFSYSNSRSLLQGGSGILFGFKVKGNKILRKGSINLESLFLKIIIPSNIKQEVRNYLKRFGICQSVLYDISTRNEDLTYKVITKTENRFLVKKIILHIIVNDIIFVKNDIQNVVYSIFERYMSHSNNILVFGYIYFDEQDKRSYNWIAMPQLINGIIDLKYNESYFKNRMIYINKEISYTKIILQTEPIIKKCKTELKNAIEVYKKYINNEINIIKYKNSMLDIRKRIFKKVYYDLQDIEHTSSRYDDYYNFSNFYCTDVDTLIHNQIIYINKGKKKKELIYFWEEDR